MNMTTPAPGKPLAEDLGIDREFVLMLARVPLIAAGFVFAAWLGQQFSAAIVEELDRADSGARDTARSSQPGTHP